MALTTEQWLDKLTKRADAQLPRIRKLRDYTSDRAPLPEAGPRLTKSWERFQQRARTNFAGLIVEAMVTRIQPNGLIVGEDPNSNLSRQARRIWRDNRLDVTISDAIYDAATTGNGYLLITTGENHTATITRERPETFYALPDPVHPWRALAAIKAWRDVIEDEDHLLMWVDGMRFEYARRSYNLFADAREYVETISGEWKLVGVAAYEGSVPVVILTNKEGKGEFEDHLSLLDRIHWQILQRLVTTAMQTFRQRALEVSDKALGGLEHHDEDGNEIDYREVFEPGPGALWELPAGVKIWESQTTDITPLLSAVKDDLRALSAETHTPLSSMLPDSANQSAAGAEAPMQALIFKATDRIKRFKPALAVCLVKALQVEGVQLAPDETVEILFTPPAMVTLAERYDAASKARAAGEALETIQRNILGYSPEQIAQDKQRRMEEQLTLLTTPQTGAANPTETTPTPTTPQTDRQANQ